MLRRAASSASSVSNSEMRRNTALMAAKACQTRSFREADGCIDCGVGCGLQDDQLCCADAKNMANPICLSGIGFEEIVLSRCRFRQDDASKISLINGQKRGPIHESSKLRNSGGRFQRFVVVENDAQQFDRSQAGGIPACFDIAGLGGSIRRNKEFRGFAYNVD